MPKLTPKEINEEVATEFDEEDQALMDHIFNDDRPPQGLHRGGYKGEPFDWED